MASGIVLSWMKLSLVKPNEASNLVPDEGGRTGIAPGHFLYWIMVSVVGLFFIIVPVATYIWVVYNLISLW